MRSKGFDVSSMNNKNPMLTRPMTPSTRATKASGRPRLNRVTASVQPPRIKLHSSSEPSCAPHTAEMRYCTGNAELELFAT